MGLRAGRTNEGLMELTREWISRNKKEGRINIFNSKGEAKEYSRELLIDTAVAARNAHQSEMLLTMDTAYGRRSDKAVLLSDDLLKGSVEIKPKKERSNKMRKAFSGADLKVFEKMLSQSCAYCTKSNTCTVANQKGCYNEFVGGNERTANAQAEDLKAIEAHEEALKEIEACSKCVPVFCHNRKICKKDIRLPEPKTVLPTEEQITKERLRTIEAINKFGSAACKDCVKHGTLDSDEAACWDCDSFDAREWALHRMKIEEIERK
jgi:hypothetical protein